MSFADMEKSELLDVAEIFGVDIDNPEKSEKNIIMDILEEGVTYDMYRTSLLEASADNIEMNMPEPEPEPVVVEEKTTQKFKSKNAVELLKMERWNPSFRILGYLFTREHPFVLVKPDEASWIMSHEEGFRVATPEEAESFYKG